MTEEDRKTVDKALQVAEQLATVASDWNLDEVQIDDEMQSTYRVRETFSAARKILDDWSPA